MLVSLNAVALYFFWGVIGLILIAPVLLLGSAYQAAKAADTYHFRGYYRLKKQHHLREARWYAVLLTGGVTFMFVFILMV
jgi:hypothetical protein